MKPSLTAIIADENARLEQQLSDRARNLIREIGKEQEAIQRANEKIAELRKELQTLEAKDIDAKAILGEQA